MIKQKESEREREGEIENKKRELGTARKQFSWKKMELTIVDSLVFYVPSFSNKITFSENQIFIAW